LHSVAIGLNMHGQMIETDSVKRTEAASAVFAREGVAPQRLALGTDWYIEGWAGDQPWLERKITEAEVRGAARLLARIHAIDPAWYDEHRDTICEHVPLLREAPLGSHMWCVASRELEKFKTKEQEAVIRKYFLAGREPSSPAGRRIVTSHGDYHDRNFVSTGSELLAIDLEFANVGYAVHDLAYCSQGFAKGELLDNFLEEYLRACESPAGPEEVELLQFDVECFTLRTFYGALAWCELEKTLKDPSHDFREYREYEKFERRACEDAALRKDIAARGFKAIAEPIVSLALFEQLEPLPMVTGPQTLVALPHSNHAAPQSTAEQIAVTAWMRLEPSLARQNLVAEWHTYEVELCQDDSVIFRFDGREVRRIVDGRYQEGTIQFIAGETAMLVRNIRVNGESAPLDAWHTEGDATMDDISGEVSIARNSGNDKREACHFIESHKYSRPILVSAEVCADGDREKADCMAINVFSPNHRVNDGYSFMMGAWHDKLEISVDQSSEQAEHFVTRMSPTFTICEAAHHSRLKTSLWLGWYEGSLTLESSPSRGDISDTAFNTSGSRLSFEHSGLGDGAWHHVAVLYDAVQRFVKLYVDGQPTEHHSLTTAVPLRLSEITVGAPSEQRGPAWSTTMQLRTPCRKEAQKLSWVHAAVPARDNLESDCRADEALRVCVHEVERRMEEWCFIPCADGTYLISLSAASRCEAFGVSAAYLCAIEESSNDHRDKTSTWVTVNSKREPSQWIVTPVGRPYEYHIQLAGPRGDSLPSGAFLHAFESSEGDKRDEESTYLCVEDGQRSVWRLNPSSPLQSGLADNQFGSHSPLVGQLPFPQTSEAALQHVSVVTGELSADDVWEMFCKSQEEAPPLS